MKKTTKSIMENLALISQVGIMMVVPIGFGVFAGNFLDNKFGTTPIWLVIMIVIGVGAAFRNLMQLATTKSKEYKNDYTARTQVENYEREQQREQSSNEKKVNEEDESKTHL
ncbi:AtpZ/AtpI family protein [Fusibacter ferrireducens]|uniref:AtpZ/AtpI family protein n=1 Tax=Fusibacter ferrireducens TaxID=2785058 RepID=A0ABR9ZVS0_9FIRM|nr:AtpZ/AtpI family protein [Fusibacter ferrireducens]MBF4694547.1 AtpZ/AtpI family protein [Fusibacter ferrireducens]